MQTPRPSQPRLAAVTFAALIGTLPLWVSACDDSSPSGVEQPASVSMDSLLAEAVSITPDPNGRTPLAALIRIEAAEPVRVTLTIPGDEPLEHAPEAFDTDHALPVLGLYPGTVNRVELRLDTGDAFAVDTFDITTEPLPDFFPDIEITTADRERMEPGWTLSALSIGTGDAFRTMPILFDSRGEIRWYLDLSDFGDFVSPVERLRNGNLLFGFGSSVHEMDMLGAELGRWDFPGWNYHHDVIEKPDGNFLVAVDRADAATIHDHVIEVDRTSGALVREWDFRDVLDVGRRDFVATDENWLHMNSLWYLEDEDALIVSGRNQSALVKVTGDNELVWILAARRGWGLAGSQADGHDTSEYLLTAVDADGQPLPEPVQQGEEGEPDFRWPWGQHTPLVLPDGNLFVFDNGFNRNFSPGGEAFSRGVEYAIDESAGTVRQIWQYGEERGENFHAAIVSDVDLLPETGNRLIAPGVGFGAESRAWVTEVTYPGGDVVFEAKIVFREALSEGALEWGNFDMVYRSERLSPYP